jgi:hypothetical protein
MLKIDYTDQVKILPEATMNKPSKRMIFASLQLAMISVIIYEFGPIILDLIGGLYFAFVMWLAG